MELNHERHKISKFAPEDVISNMPDIVITNILDRLPLQYAVRTGVLLRNWRFKWTMLSQVVFDDKFFTYLSKTESKNNYVRIISRILISLRCAITKFVLSIDCILLDAEDINHWILFLSIKGIKDLTLQNMNTETLLKLPSHLFSCLELKHLKLLNCCFHIPPIFHGFPNLLSLELRYVELESGTFGDLFTQCPVLENLKLTEKVKLAEVAKLENLKILALYLLDVPGTITNSSSIFELVDSLPKLQELTLYLVECKLTEDGAKKRFPSVFPSLKALKILRIDLDNGMELLFALELITRFSNLQTLEITTTNWDDVETPEMCFPEVDYNTMEPLQLRSVVLTTCCHTSEKDVSLIKHLLACSPFLKTLVIYPLDELVPIDAMFVFAKKLLKLQQAYPTVDIDIHPGFSF